MKKNILILYLLRICCTGGDKIKTVLFSDLDSTFLDKETYSMKNNGHITSGLIRQGHLVVFATSKTFRETRFYLMQAGINIPFITENGGALYIPERFPDSLTDMTPASDSTYTKKTFGTPIEESESVLNFFAETHSLDIRSMHRMTSQEVSELTGLPLWQSAFAIKREFDLTFTLPRSQEEIIPELIKELENRNLVLQKGGRFWHITGQTSKAVAAKYLIDSLSSKPERVVAMGDSENDLDLLRYADKAVIIPDRLKGPDKVLTQNLPEALIASLPAPEGWEQSILELFDREDI